MTVTSHDGPFNVICQASHRKFDSVGALTAHGWSDKLPDRTNWLAGLEPPELQQVRASLRRPYFSNSDSRGGPCRRSYRVDG